MVALSQDRERPIPGFAHLHQFHKIMAIKSKVSRKHLYEDLGGMTIKQNMLALDRMNDLFRRGRFAGACSDKAKDYATNVHLLTATVNLRDLRFEDTRRLAELSCRIELPSQSCFRLSWEGMKQSP